MSIQFMCSGDTVKKLSFSNGSWGDTPTPTLSSPFDCRIDINGMNEDRQESQANEILSGEAFFSSNPLLVVGDYLVWTHHANVAKTPQMVLRVIGTNEEGRPGSPSWLWHVNLVEDRSKSRDIEGLLA